MPPRPVSLHQAMISLPLTPFSATSPSLNSPLIPNLNPIHTYLRTKKLNQRRVRNGKCRAGFSQDAPFAVAIGACILNSLVFPIPSGPDDGESDSVIDSSDARLAVMGIISFIPYFNWLSWVFALLDTGKRRYAVYAIVYLAPYVRSNLSLSPEESWLPIASILFCIIHIQLETSIENGDLQGFQLFSKAEKDIRIYKEENKKSHKNLPSAQEQSRTEIGEWGVPGKPSRDPERLNEDDGEANKDT